MRKDTTRDFLALPDDFSRSARLKNVHDMIIESHERHKRLTKASEDGKIDIKNTADGLYKSIQNKYGKNYGLNNLRKLTDKQLKTYENRLASFLNAETSTVKGAKDVYARRAKTLKDEYGLNLKKYSSEEINNIFDAMYDIVANSSLSSSQALMVIENISLDDKRRMKGKYLNDIVEYAKSKYMSNGFNYDELLSDRESFLSSTGRMKRIKK